MADVSLWAVFGTGVGGSLIGGLMSMVANIVQQRGVRRTSSEAWIREVGYPALQMVLTKARLLDEWATTAAVTRGLGLETTELGEIFNQLMRELDGAATSVELLVSSELSVAVSNLVREARATVSKETGSSPELADAIRRTAEPDPEDQRPLHRLRKELIRVAQRELGILSGRATPT